MDDQRLVRTSAMHTYTVEKVAGGEPCFQVLASDGTPSTFINEFLGYLAARGRSAYTLRSCATGLAHFFAWLLESKRRVDDVTRRVVQEYIASFGKSPPSCFSGRKETSLDATPNKASHPPLHSNAGKI